MLTFPLSDQRDISLKQFGFSVNELHFAVPNVHSELAFLAAHGSVPSCRKVIWLEVELFEEAAIPWQEIAFRTIGMTLRHYFEDRKAGSFGFHARDLVYAQK